jgi:type II secretory pathway component PulF
MKESDFFKQLGLLLKAGATLPEAFESFKINSPRQRNHFSSLQESMEQGHSLSQALENSHAYTEDIIHSIQMAEQNDTVHETLIEISRFHNLQSEFKKRIKNIFIYPLFVIFINLVLWILICGFILPQFGEVFDDLLDGEPLPGLTELVLSVSNFVSSHLNIIVVSLIVSFSTFILLLTEIIRIKPLHNFGFATLSFFSRFPSYLNASKLCSFMAIHLKNGRDYPNIFANSAQIVNGLALKKDLKRAAAQLESGQSLNDAVSSMKYTDPLVKHILKNETEDKLSIELIELSELFYQRSRMSLDRMIALFNLFLIFLTALLVGLSIIAMYLPMISLVNNLGW